MLINTYRKVFEAFQDAFKNEAGKNFSISLKSFYHNRNKSILDSYNKL